MSGAAELWVWEKCRTQIRSLAGRKGFPDKPTLDFLGYQINLKTGEITDKLQRKPVKTGDIQGRRTVNSIFYVLSAYSQTATATPTGKHISANQFRGVKFTRRDNQGERYRILRRFEENPERLAETAQQLGGSKIDFPYGDIAVTINSLPEVPITIVVTKGDEELPGDARIFYDESIEQILDSEQTYFLTNLTITRLGEATR